MSILYTKVKLYLEANSKTWEAERNNIKLENIGDGDYIHTWNVDNVSKPTAEQLASYETAANKEEANAQVRSTRKAAYGDIGEQLDEIYKDIDSWKTRITKIKTDNPKE